MGNEILDNLINRPIQQTQSSEIVIPTSLSDDYADKTASEIIIAKKREEIEKLMELRKRKLSPLGVSNIPKSEEVIIPTSHIEIAKSVKDVEAEKLRKSVEFVKGLKLNKEEENVLAIKDELENAMVSIPDSSKLNWSNVVVEDSKLKNYADKTGYKKLTVRIERSEVPKQITTIATYVKTKTKGLIFPRYVDLIMLGNLNKTQLRDSNIKLTTSSIVFKPDVKKLKVNKGTRFILAASESYESTGNLLIYIQESRNKKIFEVSPKDFSSSELFSEFIGDRIVEYYYSGFDVVAKKLELRGMNTPLMTLTTKILRSGEFKAKMHTDGESNLYAVDFHTKLALNQWLYVSVETTDVEGNYRIVAKNKIDASWEQQISKEDVTISHMLREDYFYQLLDSLFSRDWTKELNLTDEDNFYYLYDKLSHGRIKQVLMILEEQKEEIGFVLKECLSRLETAKNISSVFEAEAIIGKVNGLDWFILTYLNYPVIGGDKRISKSGDRNYNARIMMFQLEYKVGETKHIVRDNNWDSLIESTGFLTGEISFPTSKF